MTREKGWEVQKRVDAQAFSFAERGVVAQGVGCMLITFPSFLLLECKIV